MAWSLAPSLKVLRDQINEAYPNRSKKSDGTIGDAAHAKTASDHNPNAQGVVCALDITHDPANGMDCQKFLEAQLANPHPNAKYFVWQGHIYSRKYEWRKRPSSGHFQHIHVSVGVGSDGKSAPGTYNDTSLWNIGRGTNMSADKLTSDEFNYLHILAYGGLPGAGYDGRYTGQGLTATLHAWLGTDPLKNPGILASKVKAKELIKPSECPSVQPPTQIDVDAIAEAVAEKLAQRLKD